MNPLHVASAFVESLLRRLVIAALVVAAGVGTYLYLTREPSGAELLEKANPGWTVAAADGLPVHVDDGSGRGVVMLGADDVGPYRIVRVDCDEVRKLFPKWLSLPDAPVGNCVRLHDADRTTWVLNVRTPMRVTQVWDRGHGPLLDRLQLGYGGGRSGRFPEGVETDLPAGQEPPEERGAGGYIVYPREGSGDRIVHIAFYRWTGETDLVFTLRPPDPP